jgi:HEAT repeat protein
MKLVMIGALVLLAALAWTPARGAEPKPLEPTPTFKWGDWTMELGPDGNIQHLFISYNARDELTKLMELGRRDEERRRSLHGVEPNLWNTIYCLSTETDLVFCDRDGTRYRETGGMSKSDLDWARLNQQQFYDAAYGYSRGNVKIVPTERMMEEPLLGEYSGNTFFWPREWDDLGMGLDYHDCDSVVALYFPGPSRPWARGGTGGGGNWVGAMGHTSVQFAPGREVGGPLGDIGIITLHEWLHQIDGQKGWKCGYIGLPGQYAPGNYHHGSHLFWMRYMLQPRMWRTMRMQAPLMSPPNKPADRYDGFIKEWLVLGEFDLPDGMECTEAGIPHHLALEQVAIDAASTMPSEGQAQAGAVWKKQDSPWEANGVRLRDAFGSPHRDTYAYAHVYVYSPDEREALIWVGSLEPFCVYLNGMKALQCWRGTAEDEASRRIVLANGWNRLLVKSLDQEGREWNLSCRFTDTGHKNMPDLRFALDKPESEIVAEARPIPPVEIQHYKWEWPVSDDWFGALPILEEEHLEAVTGLKGIRILGAPDIYAGREMKWEERRWTMIDVSHVDSPENVLSVVVPSSARKITLEQDSTLNNVLNMSRETGDGRGYESMMLLRYKKADGGHGDLVFVRADMIEPFMDIGKKANPSIDHSARILGFICRDTKTFLVFDTDLGDRLPTNEMDMLVAKGENAVLSASPDRPRVLRGDPCSLTCEVLNSSSEPLNASVELAIFGSDEPTTTEDLGEIAPGEHASCEFPVDTSNPESLVTYIATVRYEGIGSSAGEVEKPIPINLFDPVGLEVRLDGSELIQVRNQRASVEVRNNLPEQVEGTLHPTFPKGYSVQPESVRFSLDGLDDTNTFWFDVRVDDTAKEGWDTLSAEATLDALPGRVSKGTLPIYKSFGYDLVFQDFESGVGGDFGFTDALYQVRLSRTGAKFGKQCLEIYDRGGARFGHVWCFGRSILPKSPQPKDTQYTYDTKVYPYVVFWFKSEGSHDNLGLHIVLDDGEEGYGVLINGLWEQQWTPRMMIGQAGGFKADGEWHRIAINLDEALDGVLGKTSHFVKEILIGDTRAFASGWWSYYDVHHHYIDNFAIRKAAPDAPVLPEHLWVSKTGLPMLSPTNRVPAFDSPPVSGLRATLRTNQLGYFPWEERLLQLWVTNAGDSKLQVPVWPRNKNWELQITDSTGQRITDGWISAYWQPERMESDRPNAAEHFRDLKPGENYSEEINIDELVGDWARTKEFEFKPGETYLVKARFAPTYGDLGEGLNPWRGVAESNEVALKMIAVPTPEEELAALDTSPDAIRRAKAAAQLGKAKYEPALPSLAQHLLGDPDGDVRLNCAWAIGNFDRIDPNDAARIEKMRPFTDAVVKALDDENWRVGEYAAMSLGRLGAKSATDTLVGRLDAESKWVRRRTADALGEMKDYAAAKALGKLLDDRSREVRESAQRALTGMCDEAANRVRDARNRYEGIPADDQGRAEERKAARAALDEWEANFRSSYDPASATAQDEFFMIRRAWVEAVNRYREIEDTKPIVQAALDDENEYVREAALQGLRAFGTDAQDCTDRTRELLEDPYDFVRRASIETLPAISGHSVEELTGKEPVEWFRMYPRPPEWPMGR